MRDYRIRTDIPPDEWPDEIILISEIPLRDVYHVRVDLTADQADHLFQSLGVEDWTPV